MRAGGGEPTSTKEARLSALSSSAVSWRPHRLDPAGLPDPVGSPASPNWCTRSMLGLFTVHLVIANEAASDSLVSATGQSRVQCGDAVEPAAA